MSLFAPRRSPLGAWILTPLGARKFAAPAGPSVESREFYSFDYFDDGGGQLGATLVVHGDEVDNMDEVTLLTAWAAGSSTTYTTAFDSISFDSDSGGDHPLGLTTLEFSGGSTWGSIPTLARIQLTRSSSDDEHWLTDGTQLLWGTINITGSAQIGIGSTSLCGGGSHTHVLGDIEHAWTWSPGSGLSEAEHNTFQGNAVLSQWTTPSNVYDFTGATVCASNSTHYVTLSGDYVNIAGGGFVVIEPSGSAFPAPGFEWIGVVPPFAWADAGAFQ